MNLNNFSIRLQHNKIEKSEGGLNTSEFTVYIRNIFFYIAHHGFKLV